MLVTAERRRGWEPQIMKAVLAVKDQMREIISGRGDRMTGSATIATMWDTFRGSVQKRNKKEIKDNREGIMMEHKEILTVAIIKRETITIDKITEISIVIRIGEVVLEKTLKKTTHLSEVVSTTIHKQEAIGMAQTKTVKEEVLGPTPTTTQQLVNNLKTTPETLETPIIEMVVDLGVTNPAILALKLVLIAKKLVIFRENVLSPKKKENHAEITNKMEEVMKGHTIEDSKMMVIDLGETPIKVVNPLLAADLPLGWIRVLNQAERALGLEVKAKIRATACGVRTKIQGGKMK